MFVDLSSLVDTMSVIESKLKFFEKTFEFKTLNVRHPWYSNY